jgi:hypothetical protein
LLNLSVTADTVPPLPKGEAETTPCCPLLYLSIYCLYQKLQQMVR